MLDALASTLGTAMSKISRSALSPSAAAGRLAGLPDRGTGEARLGLNKFFLLHSHAIRRALVRV